MKWAEHVACIGVDRVLYRALVGKPEGKIPHRRLKRRRENIIKTYFQEVRCSVMC